MDSRYVLFLLLTMHCLPWRSKPEQTPKLGSSLAATGRTPWRSPSGRFAFGFYPDNGGGFSVGIWLYNESERIITWTANRDDPPLPSTATVELTPDGIILHIDGPGNSNKSIASVPDQSAYSAFMNDSGNFVLYDRDSQVVWESFNSPTDTILGGQLLSRGEALHSSLSKNNHSTGRFCLKMQQDGNLVLYPVDSTKQPEDAYWASGTCCNRRLHLYLNSTGAILLINDTDSTLYDMLFGGAAMDNRSIVYRAVVDPDGIFRLYSHHFIDRNKFSLSTVWSQPEDKCAVKGFCGFNSYCTLDGVDQRVCRCLPGTDFIDIENKWHGCEKNFTEEWCRERNASAPNIVSLDNMTWSDPPYFEAVMKEEDCSNSCLDDCNCDVAVFYSESNQCTKQALPLNYVGRSLQASSKAFFKVGFHGVKKRHINSMPSPGPARTVVIKNREPTVLLLVVSLGLVTWSCGALAVAGFFALKSRFFQYRKLLERGEIGFTEDLALRSFSYKELKRATSGFKEELGRGSFGTVYKGSLSNGKRIIAVKRLEKLINDGEREFRAEMQVIGRTRHKNLVRLLGYCTEDSKRLLVYEFMSNGSLADLLFRAKRRPDWNERARIASEIAKGILYLHEECDAPTIHCDIKPQNILMDDFWTVKISDFGLAKLLMPDQTRTFTQVRGTKGYVAPEWHKNTPISVKADVYSYGIVLLETVFCRRHMEVNVPNPEEIILPTCVYKHFCAGELDKLLPGEAVDKLSLERLVKVGLWCIQDEPALRPSMKSVVMMLDGTTDILVPPCPTSAAHIP